MAGRYDVAAPPPFDPFIGIDLPACVVEDCVDRHEHEHEKRHADMERQDEREDREKPSGADGFNRVKGETRPGRWLYAAMMAFMGPFK